MACKLNLGQARYSSELISAFRIPSHPVCGKSPEFQVEHKMSWLLKELIHDFGALGQGRPDLVPVHALGDRGAAVADQAGDVF